MTISEVRKTFEHGILPGGFYRDRKNFIGMILHKKEVVFEILRDMYIEQGLECPYSSADFSVFSAKLSDDVSMLKLSFPEPEEVPLCYCSYLFFDKDFEKIMFCTVEKGENTSYPVAGVWTEQGDHISLGNCLTDDKDDFRICSVAYRSAFPDVK